MSKNTKHLKPIRGATKASSTGFEVSIGTLRDPAFIDAMRRIYSSDKLPNMKTVFHTRRLLQELDKHTTDVTAVYRDLVMKYCEKDKNGNPTMHENNSYKIPDASLDKFNKEVEELYSTKITVPMSKMKAIDLTGVTLAPAHLTAMDEILDWSGF